jgi:hypothetical protein
MSVRFCQKCGITVDDGDAYCHNCGAEMQIKISEGGGVPEIVEYCARCGLPVYAGDRFCSNCGTDRTARVGSLRVYDEKGGGRRVSSRRGGRYGVFKIALAVLFWGAIVGGCYAAYRHFWSDIPWNEVAAVVTEPQQDAGALFRDAPREAFPPIAPETVSPDASYADDPQNREITPVKLAWGAQGRDGISVLMLSDGAPASDLSSLPGSVTGSRVRLRAEPSTQARILGVLESGDGVDIMKRFSSEREKFVWYNVRTEKGDGWIYGEFVRVVEDE